MGILICLFGCLTTISRFVENRCQNYVKLPLKGWCSFSDTTQNLYFGGGYFRNTHLFGKSNSYNLCCLKLNCSACERSCFRSGCCKNFWLTELLVFQIVHEGIILNQVFLMNILHMLGNTTNVCSKRRPTRRKRSSACFQSGTMLPFGTWIMFLYLVLRRAT